MSHFTCDSLDFHLRYLINKAKEESKDKSILGNIRPLVRQAFAIISEHFEKFFNNNLSSELLVLFAEVACLVPPPIPVNEIERALDLYDRCDVKPNQFVARGYLVRCQIEGRKNIAHLKGLHLVQQVRHALQYLLRAIQIAQMPEYKTRYNFIIYNASLIYWDIVRPVMRLQGWQSKFLEETSVLLEALNGIASGTGGAAAPNMGGYVNTKTPVDIIWRIEFMLHFAFGQEDAGKTPDAQKTIEDANNLLKSIPPESPQLPHWLKPLIQSARAWFGRTNKVADLRREDPDSLILFIRNKGISAQSEVEGELVKYWASFDPAFTDFHAGKGKVEVDRPGNAINTADVQLKLAAAIRAACSAQNFNLANVMFQRMVQFRAPPPRGRILIDLSKAELDVWKAENEIANDKTTATKDVPQGMILPPNEQIEREMEARIKAIRLCEQCIVAAKRTEDIDLVEESALLMYNFAIPLLENKRRALIHKSLSKGADVLAELEFNFYSLRTILHYEAARCEIANDLLTKGQEELKKANAMDSTTEVKLLAEPPAPANEDELLVTETGLDPAPFVRPVHTAQLSPLLHLLSWKLALYDDPAGLDQIMLWLDATGGQSVSSNVIEKAFHKLVSEEFEPLYRSLVTDDTLRKKYVKLPQWINSEKPITPYNPNHAPCTVWPIINGVQGIGPSQVKLEDSSTGDMDLRMKSDRELGIQKMKIISSLFSQCAKLAIKKKEIRRDLVLEMCDKVLFIEKTIDFGPWPIEIEFGISLAEAAYVKAECLQSELYSICGIVEETVFELGYYEDQIAGPAAAGKVYTGSAPEPHEYRRINQMKRDIFTLIRYGIEISDRFKQDWLVYNGLILFWNFHMQIYEVFEDIREREAEATATTGALVDKDDLVDKDKGVSASTVPQLVLLIEFFPAIRYCLELGEKYFLENQSHVLMYLSLLYLDSTTIFEQSKANEVNSAPPPAGGEEREDVTIPQVAGDTILQGLLSKLHKVEKKEVSAKITALANGTPIPQSLYPATRLLYPDLQYGGEPLKILEGTDKKLDLRLEGDVMSKIEQIVYLQKQNEKDEPSALNTKLMPLVTEACNLLNGWQPRFEDEVESRLYLEMWTRLGRNCLEKFAVDADKTAPKYGLMCGIRALSDLDIQNIGIKNSHEPHNNGYAVKAVGRRPNHCSDMRSAWRGAAFALCGSSLAALVDPGKQEKESVLKLRYTAINQFTAALEHCTVSTSTPTSTPTHVNLAIYAAKRLYNIAYPLLSADFKSRLFILNPLLTASRILSNLQCDHEPELLIAIYTAIFEILSARSNWQQIQYVLNQAFKIVPQEYQRTLWALRMVALSRQGKNVAVAMGKTKETQASAQARIWIILAHSSFNKKDQLSAYLKAIEILENAQQFSVIDVKIELCDLLSRSKLGLSTNAEDLAYYMISHAADILLEIEDEILEDEEGEGGKSSASGSQRGSQRSRGSRSVFSKGSKKGMQSNANLGGGGSASGQKSGSKAGSKAGSVASRSRSKNSKGAKSSTGTSRSNQLLNANDGELPVKLNALHYEYILRVCVAQLVFAQNKNDLHQTLITAVHFVMRIFETTIQLANDCALALYTAEIDAIIEAEEAEKKKIENQTAAVEGEEKPVTKHELMLPPYQFESDMLEYGRNFWTASTETIENATGLTKIEGSTELETENAKHQMKNLAFAKTEIQPVYKMIEAGISTFTQSRINSAGVPLEEIIYAGHTEMFRTPVLSWYALSKLEDTLEEHGYYICIFPILDLHQILINSVWGGEIVQTNLANSAMSPDDWKKLTLFEQQKKKELERLKERTKETMDVFISIKRARNCHICQMFSDSKKHWSDCKGFLYTKLDESFVMYREIADAAKAGRGGSGGEEKAEKEKLERELLEGKQAALAGAGGEGNSKEEIDEGNSKANLDERGPDDPIPDPPLRPDEILDLDATWVEQNGILNVPDDSPPPLEANHWRCSDKFPIYQVWLQIAENCVHFGETNLAVKLVEESLYHAKCHGDARCFRKATLFKAKLLLAEGKSELVLKEIQTIFNHVQGGDVEDLVEITKLCKQSYEQLNASPVYVEGLLQSSLETIVIDIIDSQKSGVVGTGAAGGGTVIGTGTKISGNKTNSNGFNTNSQQQNATSTGSPTQSSSAANGPRVIVQKMASTGSMANSKSSGSLVVSNPGDSKSPPGMNQTGTMNNTNSMRSGGNSSAPTSTIIIHKISAECMILFEQLMSKMGKLALMQVSSRDYFEFLSSLWQPQAMILEKLQGVGMFSKAMSVAMEFSRGFGNKIISILQSTYEPGLVSYGVLASLERNLLKILDSVESSKAEILQKCCSSFGKQSSEGNVTVIYNKILAYDVLVSQHRREKRRFEKLSKLEEALKTKSREATSSRDGESAESGTAISQADIGSPQLVPGKKGGKASPFMERIDEAEAEGKSVFQPPSRRATVTEADWDALKLDPEAIYTQAKIDYEPNILEKYLDDTKEIITRETETKMRAKVCSEIDRSVCDISSAFCSSQPKTQNRLKRFPNLGPSNMVTNPEGGTPRAAKEVPITPRGAPPATPRGGVEEFAPAIYVPPHLAEAEVELGLLMIERETVEKIDKGSNIQQLLWATTNTREDFEYLGMSIEDQFCCEQEEKNYKELALGIGVAEEDGAEGGAGGEQAAVTSPADHDDGVFAEKKDPNDGPDLIKTGIEYLDNSIITCLKHRHFTVGYKAAKTLATMVYGVRNHQKCFHYLCLTQLFSVLDFGFNTIMEAVLPPNHIERILLNQLTSMSEQFSRPELVNAYLDVRKQLDQYPLFDLLNSLLLLPPTTHEIVETIVPTNTLYISMQLEDSCILVGTSANIDGKTSYFCFKVFVKKAAFWNKVQRMHAIYLLLEKDLLANSSSMSHETNPNLADYHRILEELDDFFAPFFRRMELQYWPFGKNYRPSPTGPYGGTPTNLVLLLDEILFNIPFEHFKCAQKLFPVRPGQNEHFITRDVSLHIMATRNTRRTQEMIKAEEKHEKVLPLFEEQPSKVPLPEGFTVELQHKNAVLPILVKESTAALVDPHGEDAFAPEETGTLFKQYDPVLNQIPNYLIGETGTREVSSQDFVENLQLNKNCIYLGFSKLLVSLTSSEFGCEDLRHMDLLVMFCRGMNDKSFRRQKAKFGDVLLVNTESVYPITVLATLRGVKTIVMCHAPVTLPLLQRISAEFLDNLFVKNLTVSRSLLNPIYRGYVYYSKLEQEIAELRNQAIRGPYYTVVPEGEEDPLEAKEAEILQKEEALEEQVKMGIDALKRRPEGGWPQVEKDIVKWYPYLRSSMLTVGLAWMNVGGGVAKK